MPCVNLAETIGGGLMAWAPMKDTVYRWLRGLFSSHDTTTVVVKDLVQRLGHTKSASAAIAADSNAAQNTTTIYFDRVRWNSRIIGAYFVPNGTANGHATNYLTLNLKKNNGGGGAASTIATASTAAANWSAGTPVTMTVTTYDVAAGSQLGYSIAKATNGENIPAGRVIVDLEYQ